MLPEKENRFYVYIWFRDDTGDPFYVGKGTKDRWKRHSHNRSKKFHEIYDYVQCHPEIIIDNLSNEAACRIERQIIKSLVEQGVVLANTSRGGEPGTIGVIRSEEYRKKYSMMFKGENNPNYGNHWTDEMKHSLSEYKIKYKQSAGERNGRATKILCVETGTLYPYMEYAAHELGLKSGSSINHALKNPRFLAGGYHFVSGNMIECLNTSEKRAEYLNTLKNNNSRLTQ